MFSTCFIFVIKLNDKTFLNIENPEIFFFNKTI